MGCLKVKCESELFEGRFGLRRFVTVSEISDRGIGKNILRPKEKVVYLTEDFDSRVLRLKVKIYTILRSFEVKSESLIFGGRFEVGCFEGGGKGGTDSWWVQPRSRGAAST